MNDQIFNSEHNSIDSNLKFDIINLKLITNKFNENWKWFVLNYSLSLLLLYNRIKNLILIIFKILNILKLTTPKIGLQITIKLITQIKTAHHIKTYNLTLIITVPPTLCNSKPILNTQFHNIYLFYVNLYFTIIHLKTRYLYCPHISIASFTHLSIRRTELFTAFQSTISGIAITVKKSKF